jgi:hypothetical protein
MRRRPFALDDETALRLVAGAVDPDDAPPGYSGVARLLADAGSTPPPLPAARASATVATMVETIRTSSPGSLPRLRRLPFPSFGTRVAATAGALVLTAGGAAATTGSLPPSIQDATARVASYVGINLPFPARTAGDDVDGNAPAVIVPAPAGAGSAGAGHSQPSNGGAVTPAGGNQGQAGSSSGQVSVSDGNQHIQTNGGGNRAPVGPGRTGDTRPKREPSDPVETKPAEPSDPSEPSDPVEHDPADPREPTDPAEPSDPVEQPEGGGARRTYSFSDQQN